MITRGPFKYNETLMNIIGTLILFLACVKLYTLFYTETAMSVEGFGVDMQKYSVKTNIDLYDKFYSEIYDELVYSNIKNEFEIGKLIETTKPTSESLILDIGSGTGHHVHELKTAGFKKTIGVDRSIDMIKRATAKYPNCKFYVADIMHITGFPFVPSTYTHLLCLYFTYYYMENKSQFLKNCFTILKPGGYMIIHIVDRNQFDPILPSGNPFNIISPQSYAPKRITETALMFNGFNYTAKFDLDKSSNTALFKETFKDMKTNKLRVHNHMLYMEPISKTLAIIKQTGFIIKEQIDMMQCAYDYQYLYVLYKPA